MSTISEKCACGAEFTASSRYNSEVKHAASEWREEHKHAESVGICGNQPAWQGPKHIPIPYCVLKAGHEGAHSDGEGSHWWRTAADPTPDPARAELAKAALCPCGVERRACVEHRDEESNA